jgi:hypothetical protein
VSIRDALDARVRAGLSGASSEWFSQAVEIARHGTLADLQRIYTDASRRLGERPLPGGSPATEPHLEAWTLEDAGRLAFLLARHDALGPDRFSGEATACFEQGDSREQRSWLRGVGFLPDSKQYLPLVIDACRTNILPIFEAVACENAYPARYFPERNFNQLVLKALFNSVALARIQGLAARRNPELARMATDYAAERRAAGRSIPADIGLATAAPAAEAVLERRPPS